MKSSVYGIIFYVGLMLLISVLIEVEVYATSNFTNKYLVKGISGNVYYLDEFSQKQELQELQVLQDTTYLIIGDERGRGSVMLYNGKINVVIEAYTEGEVSQLFSTFTPPNQRKMSLSQFIQKALNIS